MTLRERMRELAPALRLRVDAAEQARCVPVASIDELANAGLFRALVPRRYGGDERDLSDLFGGVVELARGCSSTAWCGSLLALHGFLVAWFDPRAQDEVWSAGPDVRIASSVAPVGTVTETPRGFSLTGRWSFVSGIDHCAWVMLAAIPKTAPGNTLFLVPANECTIEDDWDVAGLRATGSKSVIVKDAHVPAYRALAIHAPGPSTGQLHAQSPLYRVPWKPMFNSAFPPIALGTAIANLETFREYTVGRVNVFSGQATRAQPGPAIRLAQSASQVDAAAALFFRDAAELEASARSGAPLPAGAATRIAWNAVFEVDACSRAIHRLWRGSGGKALHRASPMQRYFRDIFAMTQHGAFDMDIMGESYGKELLAQPELGALR